MDKKYILVGCGGRNSEIKKYLKEWNSFKDCYEYVRNEVKNKRMGDGGIIESKEEDWIMWERESYMLDIDCWRKDIKLNDKDVVIGIWGLGENEEVYEVIIGDSINDKRYKYNINVGDLVDGDGESGICVGFDDDEVLLYNDGEGWSCNIEDCKVQYNFIIYNS